MQLFSIALIAKIVCKIINNPESLLARILKGKYYHSGDLIEFKRRAKSLWGWLNFLEGRDLLKLGLMKKICNGKETIIWEEPWVLSLYTFRKKPPNLYMCLEYKLLS